MSLTIAKRYAGALFGLISDKTSELDLWICFFSKMEKILSDKHIHELVVLNPILEGFQRAEILISILNLSEMPKYAYNFVSLLIEKNRMIFFSEIFEQFQILKDEHEGISQVFITSAFPLSETELKGILPILERRFQKNKLKAKISLEQSLIGGACFQVNDEVLDCSILKQLTCMGSAIKNDNLFLVNGE